MQNVIIDKTKTGIDIFILEEDELCEMYSWNEQCKSILGNIYIGKIDNIVNGMQAAFVDIGVEKKAFISVKDAMKKVDVAKEELDSNVKMSDVVKIGQKVLVQVKKEHTEEKGARVSTHITFPGQYVVLMPSTNIITVSQKIENEEEKQRLKNIVSEMLPDDFGAIIRTDAENMSENAVKEDLKNLLEAWHEILEKVNNEAEIGIVYNDYNIIDKTIRDVINQNTDKVYTNDEEIYKKVKKARENTECILDKEANLISKFNIENEISRAQNRKIWLKCGGYIAIDKTEALTAIDVNSSKYIGSKDFETTILRVNLEAAVEIMKQLRLKDIGGIVIVDYIDMKNDDHKNQILETMKEEAKRDRSRVDIREFTQLNLVELTRKKMYV